MVADLAAIAQALGAAGSGHLQACVAQAAPNETHLAVAASLKTAGANGKGLLLLGALATAHPDYSVLKALAYLIGTGQRLRGRLPAGRGQQRRRLSGRGPAPGPGRRSTGRPDRPARSPRCWPPRARRWSCGAWSQTWISATRPGAMAALGQADFVVAASAFRSPALESVAQVLLPIGAFAETSGTYVNGAGTWQGFQGAVAPPGEARPGWKVLRVLGNLLGLPGFDYGDTAAIRAELAALLRRRCARQYPGWRLRRGAQRGRRGPDPDRQCADLRGRSAGPPGTGLAADSGHGDGRRRPPPGAGRGPGSGGRRPGADSAERIGRPAAVS